MKCEQDILCSSLQERANAFPLNLARQPLRNRVAACAEHQQSGRPPSWLPSATYATVPDEVLSSSFCHILASMLHSRTQTSADSGKKTHAFKSVWPSQIRYTYYGFSTPAVL